jgi:hypothetical protein
MMQLEELTVHVNTNGMIKKNTKVKDKINNQLEYASK